jgi:hypothetical protein
LDPPFLDLAYYVGECRPADSLSSFKAAALGHLGDGRIIGLAERPEELCTSGPRLIVRTEGEDFSGPMRSDTKRLFALGQKVFEAFVRTAKIANCLYGAILVEYELETPQELRADPRSLAFRDFFLSRHNLSEEVYSRVLALVPRDVYTQETSVGVYISTSREFNPEKRGIETELAHEVSVRVAVAIGELVP